MNFSHVSGSRAAACALLVAITPVLSAQSSQTRPLNLSKLRMESHGVSTTSGTVGYGPGFKAIFEKRSVDFRVQGGHAIELEFEAVSRGGALLRHASESASLSHADRVVTYDHGGGLTERYDVRLEGVEQSFVFDEPFLAEWERRMPHAEVRRFPDCGHYVLEDAADEIVPAVQQFMDR